MVIYFDDILIFNRKHEHILHLMRVLESLCKEKLCQLEEMCISSFSRLFPWVIVSRDGVAVDPDKVKAIRDWPIHEVRTSTA